MKKAEEKLLADEKFVKALTSLFTLADNISNRVEADINFFGDNHNPHARMRDLDLQFDEVIINGKKYEPNMMHLPYEWIIKQAFNNNREDYTVTFFYKKKVGAFNIKQGTLKAGDYLNCEDGLIINAADTSRA